MKPSLLVIAGPNGSGKTTVTERLRKDHWSEGVEYLRVLLEIRTRWSSTIHSAPSSTSAASSGTSDRQTPKMCSRSWLERRSTTIPG